jgi:hypothetical protein
MHHLDSLYPMPFMELIGTLPCLQEPISRPYHEPDESSPHSHAHSL